MEMQAEKSRPTGHWNESAQRGLRPAESEGSSTLTRSSFDDDQEADGLGPVVNRHAAFLTHRLDERVVATCQAEERDLGTERTRPGRRYT